MDVSLKDKVILITGSTKGIGRALAESFIKDGAGLVINYHADDEQAARFRTNESVLSGKSLIVKADVCKERDMIALRDSVMDKYGRIDVLINNVGILDDSSIKDMSLSQWERVLTTNLTGTFICTKYFLDIMIEQRAGKILNIASLKGMIGAKNQINYVSSKAGLIGMTKSLAKELGPYNISVNAICPGYIETDLNRNIEYKKAEAKRASVLNYESCMDDLISFTTLLCSNRINGVSGQVFHIDSRII